MIVSLKLELHLEACDDFPVVIKESEDVFQSGPYVNRLYVCGELLIESLVVPIILSQMTDIGR